MTTSIKVNQSDLDAVLAKKRHRATVVCRAVRQLGGSQPADKKGLESFVQHVMGLDPDSEEFTEAVARIMDEEIGERETTPEGGELDEKSTYAVNVFRRNAHGPYLLNHQIQACIKAAASRLGFFVKKRGSKGDMAELGTVSAIGDSLQDPTRNWEIHCRNGVGEAKVKFKRVNGKVSTPQGAKSIQHDTEFVEEGSNFAFEFSWMKGKLTPTDFLSVMAAATQIGLGSCRSLGYGRFEVVEMEVFPAEGDKKDKKEDAKDEV